MSLGLRLGLLLLLIACAHQQLVVPQSDWEKVPAAQRAAIDRKHEADMASAQNELKLASAGLADAQRAPAVVSPAAGTAGIARPDPDADVWAVAIYDHDQSRTAARTRVVDAATAWQRARLTWRQRQLEVATARVDLLASDRELTRARAIDRSLPGTDHYDSAPLQGQFSVAQKRWYTAATAARVARVELERASTTLASAKEAYAQLMRNGPVRLTTQLPTESDERPRLELTAWSISRSDIRRRKGLRHLLDAAASGAPQLRKRDFQLRPMPRAPASETPRASAPLVAPLPGSRAPAAPAAEATPAATSRSVEPARPAGATSSLAPSAAQRPVSSAPTPKPWDDVLDPTAPPPAPRPTTAAIRPVAPTPKPWDFIEPAAPPTRPSPAITRAAPAITRAGVAVAQPVAAVATRAPMHPAAPSAPKPWDFVEPAAQPVARRSAPRLLPVANASPAAKPWDFIEPAARPAIHSASAMHEP